MRCESHKACGRWAGQMAFTFLIVGVTFSVNFRSGSSSGSQEIVPGIIGADQSVARQVGPGRSGSARCIDTPDLQRVSTKGKKFIFSVSPPANAVAPPPRFTVVLNWTSLVKK